MHRDTLSNIFPRTASTPNCLTFVKTTAIAYGQKIDQSLRISVVCNSSRFYKRQAIGSTVSAQIRGRSALNLGSECECQHADTSYIWVQEDTILYSA